MPRIADDPWWRSRTPCRRLDPDVAAMLRGKRADRGWSLEDASYETGVSPAHLSRLENAQRAPSVQVAQDLADVYRLDRRDRAALLATARPFAGRSSPFRTGIWP